MATLPSLGAIQERIRGGRGPSPEAILDDIIAQKQALRHRAVRQICAEVLEVSEGLRYRRVRPPDAMLGFATSNRKNAPRPIIGLWRLAQGCGLGNAIGIGLTCDRQLVQFGGRIVRPRGELQPPQLQQVLFDPANGLVLADKIVQDSQITATSEDIVYTDAWPMDPERMASFLGTWRLDEPTVQPDGYARPNNIGHIVYGQGIREGLAALALANGIALQQSPAS